MKCKSSKANRSNKPTEKFQAALHRTIYFTARRRLPVSATSFPLRLLLLLLHCQRMLTLQSALFLWLPAQISVIIQPCLRLHMVKIADDLE